MKNTHTLKILAAGLLLLNSQSKLASEPMEKSLNPSLLLEEALESCPHCAKGMKAKDMQAILHAPNLKALEKIIAKQNRRYFLQQLCQSQKQFSKIPYGCYELEPLSKETDPFCLKLSVKHLNLTDLKKALSLKTLSRRCRAHLKSKLKILNYRKLKKLDTL